MDNSTGIYQVWTEPIDYSYVNGVGEEIITGSRITSIYPIPSSSTINITYHISQRGHVSLKILNFTGAVIAELVNEMKLPGDYEVEFYNTGIVTNGIFFCHITTAKNNDIRRIIFIE
jgi:hypothetical protein